MKQGQVFYAAHAKPDGFCDDPLADLLKSTREDVIAQKLRESGHK